MTDRQQTPRTAQEEILDEIHRALREGDFLTYDRIMARFSPFTSMEAVLYAHAREIVAAAEKKGDTFTAWDYCRRLAALRDYGRKH